jgi:hypothetical protein
VAEEHFAYGGQRGMFAAAIAFFGACGTLFVHLGLTGELVRLWPLPLMVTGWPVFGLAALSFGFVAVGAAQIVAGYRLGPRELVIAPTFLEAPKNPWTRKTVRVTHSAVRQVKTTDIMGTRVVELVFDGGTLALSNRTVGDAGLEAVRAWLARSPRAG